MAEDSYEERTVRMHVRRLREILSEPQVTPGSAAFLLLPSVQGGALAPSPLDKNLKPLEDEEEALGPLAAASLPAIFDIDFGVPLPSAVPVCVQSVTLSPLNPPPPHRRLHGDLAYLDVVLCDGRALTVTACPRGFFVNATPGPLAAHAQRTLQPQVDASSAASYTLAGLLAQVSPGFKRNVAKLLAAHAARDPLESIPHQSTVAPWVVAPPAPHAPDWGRLEDWVSNSYGMEGGAISRDWNEEHQSCRELPRVSPRDATVRQRTIFKITADFVDAAAKGAVAVIDRSIPPINPMDPVSSQMYVYNSIFFSFAIDRGGASGEGDEAGPADQATFASSNADLVGVQRVALTDPEGLYTLATALVDYRGTRVVAQSIIPGILQGEQLSSLVYGSVDGGNKMVWNETFHERLKTAADALHVKESVVVDGAGAEHRLCAPVECKGILGSDNRMYLLDVVRVAPADPSYTGDQRAGGGFLRWELVDHFVRARAAAAADAAPPGAPPPPPLALNPNVLPHAGADGARARPWRLAGTDTEADEALVRACAASVHEAAIPALVARFRALAASPVDGAQLVRAMHAEGVNCRHLGALHAAAAHVPYVQLLAEREMLARGCKHLLRAGLAATGQAHLAAAIAHFFNCLLGRVSPPGGGGRGAGKTKRKGSGLRGAGAADGAGPLVALGSDTLWAALAAEVQARFGFALGERTAALKRADRLPLLRAVAQRAGLQLLARAYDLGAGQPLGPEDVQGLRPVVKGTLHAAPDAQALVAAGKALLQAGSPASAQDALHEALQQLHQTCGPLHEQTAECYAALAMANYHARDALNALACQQKAVVILERLLGWDHPDVALGYGNLALFSHALQEHRRAVLYIRRAEQLLLVVCGARHPDVAALYINAAMVYLDLGRLKPALRYLHASLTISESVLGEGHLQSAQCLHATAVALSMMAAPSLAVKNEQRCLDILRAHLPADDPRVTESSDWARTFAARAKMHAQQAQPAAPLGAAPAGAAAEPGGAETLKPIVFGPGGRTAPAQR